jgi:NAD(P)H-dependent FMN reductase
MSRKILVLSCSPKGSNGNSAAIARGLYSMLGKRHLDFEIIYLAKMFHLPDDLLQRIERADDIIISFPVYQNTVPGLVIRFFEYLYGQRYSFTVKQRRLFAIANSGFPEPEAGAGALECCRLFTRAMGFAWLGGVNVAPGTMTDGKELEQAGRTYAKLSRALDILSQSCAEGSVIPEAVFSLLAKPLFSPALYRLFGRMIQGSKFKKMKMKSGK